MIMDSNPGTVSEFLDFIRGREGGREEGREGGREEGREGGRKGGREIDIFIL